jgi:hypothetical protein
MISGEGEDRYLLLAHRTGVTIEPSPMSLVVALENQVAKYDKKRRVFLGNLVENGPSRFLILFSPEFQQTCALRVTYKNEMRDRSARRQIAAVNRSLGILTTTEKKRGD